MSDIVNSGTISTPVESQNTPTSPSAVDNSPKFETITVNGKEVKVSIDELKRAYGLDKTAYSRLEEAAKIRKEAENLKSSFSQKKVESLLAAGWTEDEIEQEAANFIVKRAKEKSMTPEQRSQAEKEHEYLRLKKESEDRILAEKNKMQKSIDDSQAQLFQTSFMNEIVKADKGTWLDLNDPVILANIINDVSASLTKYNYDMPVAEAVRRQEERMKKRGPMKKEYLRELLKTSIKDTDDTDLDAFLEKGSKGVREKSVEALKRSEAPFAKPKTSQTQGNSAPVKPDTAQVRDAQYYRDVKYGRRSPI